LDPGETVAAQRLSQILSPDAPPAYEKTRLVSTPSKAITFGVPPQEIALNPARPLLDETEIEAGATVRLYDFGVARLGLHLAAADLPWTDFTLRLTTPDRCVGPAACGDVRSQLLGQIHATFGDAFLRPSRSMLEEDYLFGIVYAFDEAMSAEELQKRIDLVPLLSGEARPLSEGARRDLLRQRFSYYTDDLVVVTWGRAFIYEPRKDRDVMDVLDVANAQLLEMRYYDHLLDTELPRMYEAVQAMPRARPMLSARRFADLARRLYALVAEVTELREKVDNALRVTEDVHLARVYTAALDLFRVSAVGASVDRKLGIIRDTYAALYEEASVGRVALMESAIIVLIAVEITLALLRH
jgi:hypothetical protein